MARAAASMLWVDRCAPVTCRRHGPIEIPSTGRAASDYYSDRLLHPKTWGPSRHALDLMRTFVPDPWTPAPTLVPVRVRTVPRSNRITEYAVARHAARRPRPCSLHETSHRRRRMCHPMEAAHLRPTMRPALNPAACALASAAVRSLWDVTRRKPQAPIGGRAAYEPKAAHGNDAEVREGWCCWNAPSGPVAGARGRCQPKCPTSLRMASSPDV